jgi:chaperone modulatory protein CbpM
MSERMSTPPRTPLKPTTVETAPRAESYLSSEQLAAVAGISTATLVSVGLVEPTPNERGHSPMFSAATAARLRRMLRLHRDLGVNLIGAAIIVDLVERLERRPGEPGR